MIQNVAAALKPGGKLVIMDYISYLSAGFYPNNEVLASIFPAVFDSFSESGGNLNVGNVLPQLLAENGFEIVSIEPIQVIAQPNDLYWQWFLAFRESYFPSLVKNGYLSETGLSAIDEALATLIDTPGSFFYLPPMCGVVGRKL